MARPLFSILLGMGLLLGTALEAQAQDEQELELTVQTRLIALPPVKTKVPLERARVRSTPLRDLLKTSGALQIAQLYETVVNPDETTEEVAVDDTFVLTFPSGADLGQIESDLVALQEVVSAQGL